MRELQFTTIVIFVSIEKLFAHLASYQAEESERRHSVVSQCILHLITTYFSTSQKLSLTVSSTTGKGDWSDMLKQLNIPVVINAQEIPKIQGIDMRIPNDVVIISGENYNVTKLLNRTLWTPATRFIVTVNDSSDAPERMMEIFSQFFVNNVVNVIILVQKSIEVIVYSYEPFKNCHGPVRDITVIGEWSSDKSQSKEFQENLGKQGVTQMHGCPMNVSVVDLPPRVIFQNEESKTGTSVIEGTEGRQFIEISKRMNFTPWFAVARDGANWGWIHPEPHGVVGEVFTGHSQFGFGNLSPTIERFEHLDLSVPTGNVIGTITWAVPVGAGKKQATWINILITEFSKLVWMCFFVTAILAVIAIRTLVAFSRIKYFPFRGNAEVIFYMISSALGVPVKIPQNCPLRTLFLAWIWSCFVMVVAYQASMGSKLTVPPVQPNINSFKDLIESNLHLTGYYSCYRLLDEEDPEAKMMKIRMVPSNCSIAEAMRRIVSNRNIAFLAEAASFLYDSIIHPKVRGKVHVMTQGVYVFHQSIVMKKKSPYAEKVNDILRRLLESGIMAQWRQEYVHDVLQTTPSVGGMSMKHMKGPFFVLGLGYVISVLVLSGESVYYYLMPRLYKKKRDKYYSSRKQFCNRFTALQKRTPKF